MGVGGKNGRHKQEGGRGESERLGGTEEGKSGLFSYLMLVLDASGMSLIRVKYM